MLATGSAETQQSLDRIERRVNDMIERLDNLEQLLNAVVEVLNRNGMEVDEWDGEEPR